MDNSIEIQLMQKDIEYIKDAIKRNDECLKDSLKLNDADHGKILHMLEDFIDKADDKYANRAQFEFWRNLLISGILLSLFLGAVANMIFKQ